MKEGVLYRMSNKEFIGEEYVKRPALRLYAENPNHRRYAASLLKEGKNGVIGFNGIYGLFADADCEPAHSQILKIKNRPNDKNGILVVPPEDLREHADISKTVYTHRQIVSLQKYLHALGIILPASKEAPGHLVRQDKEGKGRTILSIWTEYLPVRDLIEKFQELGGRALAGTSANRSGQPTHFDSEAVWKDFNNDVSFVLEADYSALPQIRKQSTSVIDLTGDDPLLHRDGNVSREEIDAALKRFGFPALQVEKKKTNLTFEELRYNWYQDMHARYIGRVISSLKTPERIPQG